MENLPILLKGHESETKQMLEYIRQVVTAGGPLHEEAKKRLAEVEQLFSGSTQAKRPSQKKVPPPSPVEAET